MNGNKERLKIAIAKRLKGNITYHVCKCILLALKRRKQFSCKSCCNDITIINHGQFNAYHLIDQDVYVSWYANCMRYFLRIHARMHMCIFSLYARSCVILYYLCEWWHAFPMRVKPAATYLIQEREISVRYRRTQILIESNCIHIGGLVAARLKLQSWYMRIIIQYRVFLEMCQRRYT